jgi:uncharacterized membrane protein YkgB
MHEPLQDSNNQRFSHLIVWAYWIDADGMKLGLAATGMGWIRLVLLLWLIPVGLALLLWGQMSLSLIIFLAATALSSVSHMLEERPDSPSLFLVALISIALPIIGIGCIIWGQVSAGGAALLVAMLLFFLYHIGHRTTQTWRQRSILIEVLLTLLALGALAQLPLFGNGLQLITALVAIFSLSLVPRDWTERNEGFYEVDAQGRPVRFLSKDLKLRHWSWPMLRPRFLRVVQQA